MMSRFRRRSLFIATVAATTTLCATAPMLRSLAADWPTAGGDARRAGISEEKIAPPLSLLWRYTALPVSATAAAGSPPTVVGNTVYYTGKNNADTNAGGVLYALDAATGNRKWIYPNDYGMKDKAVFLTAPVVSNGKVYIGGSDGYLYQIDANTGKELAKIRTGGAISGTPVVDGGTLYFPSNDHTVYAFNADSFDGVSAWRVPYKTKENVNSALIAADGYLFFTTGDQNLHGVVASTGRPKWDLRLPFKYFSDAPVYADNTLYIPSGPRLFAVQPTSGNFRWTVDLPGEILAPPAAGDGVVYVSCRNAETQDFLMYAIRSANHRTVWSAPTVLPAAPSAAPTIVGDVLYVPTRRGVIVALSREDGKVLWQYRAQASANRANAKLPEETAVASPLAVANGTIYAVTDDGTISAFRADAPDSTPPLLTSHYPASAQSIYGGPGMVITGTIMDPGSGLDTDSIKMTLDGVEVTTGYNPSLNLAWYQRKGNNKMVDTSSSLTPGRHTVNLTAKDYKGNVLNETWSFIVDNALKPPTVNYANPQKRSAPRASGITAPGRGSTPPPPAPPATP